MRARMASTMGWGGGGGAKACISSAVQPKDGQAAEGGADGGEDARPGLVEQLDGLRPLAVPRVRLTVADGHNAQQGGQRGVEAGVDADHRILAALHALQEIAQGGAVAGPAATAKARAPGLDRRGGGGAPPAGGIGPV